MKFISVFTQNQMMAAIKNDEFCWYNGSPLKEFSEDHIKNYLVEQEINTTNAAVAEMRSVYNDLRIMKCLT